MTIALLVARFVALIVTVRIGSDDGDDGENNNCDLGKKLSFNKL
jgi:hypothetical protein